jgi:hypothetical protein
MISRTICMEMNITFMEMKSEIICVFLHFQLLTLMDIYLYFTRFLFLIFN